jgi:hypothetical protein
MGRALKEEKTKESSFARDKRERSEHAAESKREVKVAPPVKEDHSKEPQKVVKALKDAKVDGYN